MLKKLIEEYGEVNIIWKIFCIDARASKDENGLHSSQCSCIRSPAYLLLIDNLSTVVRNSNQETV